MVAAVTRPTQGLLMAFLGAVLLRLGMTDAYLRYVTDWMRWPILASGVLLIGLAVGLIISDPQPVEGEPDDHGHGVPLVTWLLVLPGLVMFTISPPELGSYLAERRSGQAQQVAKPASLSELDSQDVVEVELSEFIWRAQEGGSSLEGQPVSLTGFVSYDGEDGWYVTRLAIGCCAADASGYQVQVADADRPPRDQWVTVTGTYERGTGVDAATAPVIVADSVVETEAPAQTYE
jgi:uncharacterized repeat protein (TIGR03943 family)